MKPKEGRKGSGFSVLRGYFGGLSQPNAEHFGKLFFKKTFPLTPFGKQRAKVSYLPLKKSLAVSHLPTANSQQQL